jgi:hypothetical protein
MKILRGEMGVKNVKLGSKEESVLRCPACHSLAVATKLPNGQDAMKCTGCGRHFKGGALRG